jgi:O-acetyl-ADP-ribose deacetylase (regulator of RNase III)
MIEAGHGNLLTAEVEALVNPVNTEGVMGKGLALQFKKAFPDSAARYEAACKNGEVVIGRMNISQRAGTPCFIINFPTKQYWRFASKLEYIQGGLVDLVERVKALGIRSIAIPPLGCGNGGLEWDDVRPLIVEAFATLPDVRVVLYAPAPAPSAAAMIDRRSTPAMTAGRAAILGLMDRYLLTGYEYVLSLVEVQKLAYFLQLAGEPLNLKYRRHSYGPYADGLRKVLRTMEGHYTEGVADGRNHPATPLTLRTNAIAAATRFLDSKPETRERFERVAQLIDGFETPFGMELLATVHWVMQHEADAGNLGDVIAKVHAWSTRKRTQMKPGHIEDAWKRLLEHGWVGRRSEEQHRAVAP